MARRIFSREFKVEAVRLVRERGVSVAQASRDIGVHENVLRKWVKEFGSDPKQAFPGHGQQKPEQLEIERLRREVMKLKAERDILKGRCLLREGADATRRAAERISALSRSSVRSGRWHGCAERWASRDPGSMPGCVAGRAPGRSPTMS